MAIFGAGIDSWIPTADGNLSGTAFGKVDTTLQNDEAGTSSTSFLDGSKSVAVTTAYQVSATGSQSGSPNTIDGIAIKVNTIAAVPSGTISVAIDQAGSTVSGTEVTVNVSDLKPLSWNFIKFASPITLVASTAYSVKVKTSVTTQVTLCCSTNATFTTIHRLVRTTTTGTPTVGASQNDNVYVIGEITAPATTATRTVTWDNTNDTNPWNMVTVGAYGIITAATTASTNYSMRVQNDLRVFAGGIFNVGSSGTAYTSTSTFTLTFHNSAQPVSGGFGLLVFSGATLNLYGATKTASTTLAANASASATSVTVAAATNWAISDVLAFASTTTTASQAETKAVSSVSGTTIGVAALTNAHLGTSPKVGEVINLTRNVVIRGRSTTQQAYIYAYAGSFINAYYTEFYWMGSTFANFRGISLTAITSGLKFDFQYCSIHDFVNTGAGIVVLGSTSGTTIKIENNVFYNIATIHVYILATSSSVVLTVNANTFILNADAGSPLVDWSMSGGTCSNNRLSSCIAAIAFGGAIAIRGTPSSVANPVMDGNIIHSCSGPGLGVYCVSTKIELNTSNWTTWCCDIGIAIVGRMTLSTIGITTWTSYSNTTCHLNFRNDFIGAFALSGVNLQAGTTPATPIGIRTNDGNQGFIVLQDFVIDNSNIGDVTAHSTADVQVAFDQIIRLALRDTVLGTGTIVGQGNQKFLSGISSDRHNQIDGNYSIWLPYATVTRDTVLYATASPSIRATPKDAANKASVGQFFISIPGGTSATLSVKVRRSVVGDGVAHNGNFPRLRVAPNPAAGIDTAQTLATATSASNGAFETLSGSIGPVTGDSVVQFYIDTDGTAGWINIDDVSSNISGVDQGGMSYALNGQPLVSLGASSGGSTRYIPVVRNRVH